MAGMAEMVQMAAILKYKRGTQCRCNDHAINPISIITKEDLRFTKPREESCTKTKQGRWRDLMLKFGHKADKSLKKERM